jgi:hypothetical protein
VLRTILAERRNNQRQAAVGPAAPVHAERDESAAAMGNSAPSASARR